MKNDYWVIMGRWSRDGKAETTKKQHPIPLKGEKNRLISCHTNLYNSASIKHSKTQTQKTWLDQIRSLYF